jgi:hypothetical protein
MLSMAAPSRPAMESTLILGNFCAASRSGMVLVTPPAPGASWQCGRWPGRKARRGWRRHTRWRACGVKRVHGLHQRAGGVDNVVDDEAGLAFHVADHVHHFGTFMSVRRLSTMASGAPSSAQRSVPAPRRRRPAKPRSGWAGSARGSSSPAPGWRRGDRREC